jgi:hypothetical protein
MCLMVKRVVQIEYLFVFKELDVKVDNKGKAHVCTPYFGAVPDEEGTLVPSPPLSDMEIKRQLKGVKGYARYIEGGLIHSYLPIVGTDLHGLTCGVGKAWLAGTVGRPRDRVSIFVPAVACGVVAVGDVDVVSKELWIPCLDMGFHQCKNDSVSVTKMDVFKRGIQDWHTRVWADRRQRVLDWQEEHLDKEDTESAT